MTLRTRAAAAAVALVAVAAPLVAGCGDAAESAAGTTATTAHVDHPGHEGHEDHTATFAGGTISPRRAAPALELKDIDGKTVNIADFRGQPVLVTFVYAHCPDVCPLIMTNLRAVRSLSDLGPKLHVIAVSVDPKGDTPEVVRSFLKRQRVSSFVDYLIGTRAQLEPVWTRWQVAQQVPKDNPELVEHSALIYGVTASGELATAYPVGFDPAAIARDLPLLAGS